MLACWKLRLHLLMSLDAMYTVLFNVEIAVLCHWVRCPQSCVASDDWLLGARFAPLYFLMMRYG